MTDSTTLKDPTMGSKIFLFFVNLLYSPFKKSNEETVTIIIVLVLIIFLLIALLYGSYHYAYKKEITASSSSYFLFDTKQEKQKNFFYKILTFIGRRVLEIYKTNKDFLHFTFSMCIGLYLVLLVYNNLSTILNFNFFSRCFTEYYQKTIQYTKNIVNDASDNIIQKIGINMKEIIQKIKEESKIILENISDKISPLESKITAQGNIIEKIYNDNKIIKDIISAHNENITTLNDNITNLNKKYQGMFDLDLKKQEILQQLLVGQQEKFEKYASNMAKSQQENAKFIENIKQIVVKDSIKIETINQKVNILSESIKNTEGINQQIKHIDKRFLESMQEFKKLSEIMNEVENLKNMIEKLDVLKLNVKE